MAWKLLAAVALLAAIAIRCGGDGSTFMQGPAEPESGVDARDLVTQAFEKTLSQKSLVIHQTTQVKLDLQTLSQIVDVSMEPPDNAYTRTTFNGQSTETVIRGEQMFIRAGNGAWSPTSVQILGYNPTSFIRAFDVTVVAPSFRVVQEIQEGGRTLMELRAEFTVNDSGVIGEIFKDEAPITALLKDDQFLRVKAAYYIGKDDNLVYRGDITFETIINGEDASVWSEFTYSRINEPVKYPVVRLK